MLADSLRLGETEIIELTFTLPREQSLPPLLAAVKGNDKQANPEVRVRRVAAGAGHDATLCCADGAELRVNARTPAQLGVLTPTDHVVVTWVVQVKEVKADRGRPGSGTIFLQCHRFRDIPLRKPLSIGVDDEVRDKVRLALRGMGAYFSAVASWLVDEFTLTPAPARTRRRLIYSGGPVTDPDVADKGFTMHGRRWLADVAVRDDRLCVVRLVEVGSRQPPRWTMLSEVEVDFVDKTSAGLADEELRAMLAGLADSGQSYIEMWNAYNEIERAAIIDDALRLGAGQYHDWSVEGKLLRFAMRQGRREAAFLRAVQTYEGELELEAATALPPEIAGRSDRVTGVPAVVKKVSLTNWTIDVEPSRDDDRSVPVQSGWLFRSLSGDRTRLRRRDEARDRIWSGQAEMPGLALLFEGKSDVDARQRMDKRFDRVLTRSVRGAFGGNAPTPSQLEALRMALRTPDILLVQGPPGTGKTQFISALLRALDELGDTAHAVNRTLLTSFEHEAVDNVASRARHHGLPPTRVDSRPGRGKQNVINWRDETVATVNTYLSTHRPDVARRDEINQLRRLAESYSDSPVADGDLLQILDEVKRLAGADLPAEFRGRIERARATVRARLANLRSMTSTQRALASATIRSIRVSEAAFADDGPARADYALPVLTDLGLLDEPGSAVLARAGVAGHADARLLVDLVALRLDLLRRLRSGRLGAVRVTHDPDIEVLLHELARRMTEVVAENVDGADDVLIAYRADLTEDLALVESTLQRYNAVLASTVQQAQSQQMNKVLDAPMPVFSTVIVDEAARANPLDLMIPLSCARERIIMVGDHKQLPHAIEMKIEKALTREKGLGDSSLSTSLFERWFTMFGGGENRDGEKTIRVIRLETQFRMHPALGTFVSSVFYGGPDAIKSHESTHALTHDLAPYRGKVAGWIDVPLAKGADKRSGTSRVREAEAERLVRELRELARLDQARKLTFGVITFYKSQQECIEQKLVDAGLGVLDDDDTFQPSAEMSMTDEPKPRPRLRVGTVDAFQGMEFDVVLLSVTRSSPPPDGLGDARDAVRRYGHLLRDSRMCVALSRQRRLLIAVGDVAMAERASVLQQVDEQSRTRSLAEGLVAFRELCEGEHGAGIRS
ncbi:MAG TPA: AAA domain-containing protein [Pseudonocardiaceae bacterium]|nr:AAA domain-containing protein [Pseudonocardiaceae bacterium]